MNRTETSAGRAAGFTLVELLISMVLTMVIIGGALTAFMQAGRSSEVAIQSLAVNDALRSAVDLMVRDFIQVGQGLPSGKVILLPSGGGAGTVPRPGPAGANLTFPVGATELTAVTSGDGLGPTVTGVTTDIVTVIYTDSQFDGVTCTIGGTGQNVTVPLPAAGNGGARITGVGDPIAASDLIMFTNAGGSALQMVTSVTNQVMTFASGDLMRLNDRTAPSGTVLDLLNPPNAATTAAMSRIRMITYFVDGALDPPRLMRQLNMNPPRTVAFGIENLQLSYDLADGVGNPTNVAAPASPNQIRKVNVFLAGRSPRRFSTTNQFFRSSLATQVAFRSLAFVDRYQ